jgi:hypothetical protein
VLGLFFFALFSGYYNTGSRGNLQQAMSDYIEIRAYNDRRMGDGVKDKGFQSLFKALPKQKKILCYLPIKGPRTKKEDWEQFYREQRTQRTAGERGTKLSINAYYQFLKREPQNDSDNMYFYAIPRGFTQTFLMNAESDYSTMIGQDGTKYEFSIDGKVSIKVGLARLKAIA